MDAVSSRTLVLNKDWRPINVIPALKAIKKICAGRALWLDTKTFQVYSWEQWVNEWSDVSSASSRMSLETARTCLPEIVVCTEYRGVGFKTGVLGAPKFSRANLFLRDKNVCFGAGTMVLMADGRQIPIESVVAGDRVVDAYGKPQSVLAVKNRFSKDVVSMRYRGSQIHTLVTKGHPYLSSTGEFKPISSFKVVEGRQRGEGDYLVCPRTVAYEISNKKVIDVSKYFPNKWFKYRDGRIFWSKRPHENGFPAFLETSEDLAYLLGLYCAEGSRGKSSVDWSFNEDEKESLASDVVRITGQLGLNSTIVDASDGGHGISVRSCSKVFGEILTQSCGTGAYHKHTPWELIGEYRKEYLKGLLLGDGYITERFNKVSFNVASYQLVLDVQSIALGMGIHATLQAGERPDGRRYWSAIFQGQNYVRIMKEILGKDVGEGRESFGNDKFVFRKLVSIEEAEPMTVYNLEVGGSHTYIANGVSVHNCQFCGKEFPSEDLTMGHIIPRSKGGPTSWTNISLQCIKCNQQMKDRTPEQAGMHLIRKPFIPTAKDLRIAPEERIRQKMNNSTPKVWEQFLGKSVSEADKVASFMYWNAELKK